MTFTTFASTCLALCLLPCAQAQIYESSGSLIVQSTAGAPGVTTTESSGVAIGITFKFDQDAGFLRVELNNLSGTGSYGPGVLTGFGFDKPADLQYVAGSYTLLSHTGPDSNLAFFNGPPISPFDIPGGLGTGANGQRNGDFDIGVGVTSGGGSPARGLDGGSGIVMTFQFTSLDGDLSDFNWQDFFDQNGSDADFGFRFQRTGTNGGGSDKMTVTWVEIPVAPEPSTYGLMGVLVLAAGVGLRRRFAASKSVTAVA